MVAFSSVAGEEGAAFGESRVVGHDAAGIAHGAEVFTGIEGEGAGDAHGADALALVSGEVGLGAVLDDPEPVFFGDF